MIASGRVEGVKEAKDVLEIIRYLLRTVHYVKIYSDPRYPQSLILGLQYIHYLQYLVQEKKGRDMIISSEPPKLNPTLWCLYN